MAGSRSIGFNVKVLMRSWAAGQEYVLYETIEHEESQYRCTTPHQSTETFDPSKFQLLKSSATVPTFQYYTSYPLDSLVVFQEAIYRSIESHTSADFFDITKFELMKGGAAEDPSVSDWQPLSDYPVNRLVVYSDVLYRCVETHTSAAFFDYTKFQPSSQPPPILAPRFLLPLEGSILGYSILVSLGNFYHDYGMEQAKAIYELADNLNFDPKIATHTKTSDFFNHTFSSLPYNTLLFLRARYTDVENGVSPWSYCIFQTPPNTIKDFEISYPLFVPYGSDLPLSLTPFESWEPGETFVRHEVYIYSDASLSTLVYSFNSSQETAVPVPSTHLSFLAMQYFKVIRVGSEGTNQAQGSFSTSQSAQKPSVSTNASFRRGETITLTTSPFSSLTPSETHASTYYQLGLTTEFTTEILANGLVSFTVSSTSMIPFSTYFLRAKHVGSFLPSEYSDPISFEIGLSVHTPTVGVQFASYLLGEVIQLSTSAFTSADVGETHVSTLWEFYKNGSLVYSTDSTTDKVTLSLSSILLGNGLITFKARHVGSTDTSEFSTTNTFTIAEPAPWAYGYGTTSTETPRGAVLDAPNGQICVSVNTSRHYFLWINMETGGVLRCRFTNDMLAPQVVCNPTLYDPPYVSTVSRRSSQGSYFYRFTSTGTRSIARRYNPPSGNLELTSLTRDTTNYLLGGRLSGTYWSALVLRIDATDTNVISAYTYSLASTTNQHVVDMVAVGSDYYLLTQANTDCFLSKMNSSDTEVWSRKLTGCLGYSLNVIGSSVYVSGIFGADGFLAEFSSGGDSQVICFEGFKIYNILSSLQENHLWVCGELVLGGTNPQGGVAHFDLLGDTAEVFTFGGANTDFFTSMLKIYQTPTVIGQVHGVTTFDPVLTNVCVVRNPESCPTFGKSTSFVGLTTAPTVTTASLTKAPITITASNYTTNPSSATFSSSSL